MTHPLHAVTSRIDRCLTQPEPNAAGRMGLVRILYALFYLWSLHDYQPAMLYRMPERFRLSIPINGWEYIDPSYGFLALLAPALAAALVLLLIGLHTRLATLAVLVIGGLMEAYFVSVNLECGNTFLKVFIPLFVLIGGDWGATYSLDALRRRRAGHTQITPADTSVRFVLPIRAAMVMLSFLFLTGAVWKSLPPSAWFSQDNLFGHMLLTDRIKNAMAGRPLAPAAGLFVAYPILDTALRWFVVCFEGLFFLSLFHRRIRALFVFTALIFHATNAIWLGVTFSQIMIVYALFIDWEAMRARLAARVPGLGQRWVALIRRAPSGVLVAGSYGLALTCGLLWHQTQIMPQAVTLGGLLDTYTIWYPVLPLATLWCAAVILCPPIGIERGTEPAKQRGQ